MFYVWSEVDDKQSYLQLPLVSLLAWVRAFGPVPLLIPRSPSLFLSCLLLMSSSADCVPDVSSAVALFQARVQCGEVELCWDDQVLFVVRAGRSPKLTKS